MKRTDDQSPPAPGLVRLEHLPAFENISYRQIDYWLRTGVIECTDPIPGSGNRRWYSPTDVARLCVLDRILPELDMHDGAHQHTPTGVITAIWNHLATRPWPPMILVQRTETGGWTTTDIHSRRVSLCIPIREAP